MTDAPELLPCPFCGGEAEWKSGGPGCAFITCKACPAETGDGSIPRIRAAWNARAPHQQALDAAREEGRRAGLEEAGDWHDLEATHYGSACGQKDGVDFALVAGWHQQHAEAIRALKGDQT